METTASRDGTKLAYDVYGQGPALIYITGASCFRTFKPIVEDAVVFAREFTVYCYDRRGRGDSGDTLPWSVEREVEDIEALIDAAGGSASLYGHSSGAILALEAALKLKGKVNRVLMYDASYVSDETERLQYSGLRQNVSALLEAGKHAEAMRHFLKGIGMPGVFVFLIRFMPDWKRMVALAPTLAYDMALTKDVPPLKRAAQVRIPVQIVAGAKSPPGIKDVARQLARVVPNARSLELAGEDHMVSAKKLLPVLIESLKREWS